MERYHSKHGHQQSLPAQIHRGSHPAPATLRIAIRQTGRQGSLRASSGAPAKHLTLSHGASDQLCIMLQLPLASARDRHRTCLCLGGRPEQREHGPCVHLLQLRRRQLNYLLWLRPVFSNPAAQALCSPMKGTSSLSEHQAGIMPSGSLPRQKRMICLCCQWAIEAPDQLLICSGLASITAG